MTKRDIVFLSALGLSIASFVIGILALTQTFKFNKNLQPTEPNAFTVGTSNAGVSGVWFGDPAKELTFDSVTNRFLYAEQSISTIQDVMTGNSLTQQWVEAQSFTTEQFIQQQSFTTEAWVQAQSYSQVQGLFTPSYGGFYSTENQYMGQVTVTAGLSSKSSLFYNYATVHTSDIVCSVTKPSTGGNSVSGDSKIYLMTSGVYKISTSVQFDQTANQVTAVALWLAVDGAPLPESGSIITIQQQNGESIPFVEFLLQFSASQFFEVKWNSFETTSFAAKFSTDANLGSVSGSNVPSVITNVIRIG